MDLRNGRKVAGIGGKGVGAVENKVGLNGLNRDGKWDASLCRVAVIDGQGGGIGKSLVEKLRLQFGNRLSILALGTNALATSAMLRAGADEGATGENAIVRNAERVSLIVGPIGIVVANAMLGELTPAMACAIGQSDALKFLIPVSRCSVQIAGVESKSLPQHLDQVMEWISTWLEGRNPETGGDMR